MVRTTARRRPVSSTCLEGCCWSSTSHAARIWSVPPARRSIISTAYRTRSAALRAGFGLRPFSAVRSRQRRQARFHPDGTPQAHSSLRLHCRLRDPPGSGPGPGQPQPRGADGQAARPAQGHRLRWPRARSSCWCGCCSACLPRTPASSSRRSRSAIGSRDRTAKTAATSGPQLAQLFQVLNTPEDKRRRALDEQLAAFPYVNGKLFGEALPIADFDRRHARDPAGLLRPRLERASARPSSARCSRASWTPRRGATSARITPAKQNILKLIEPLFLDELWAEFQHGQGQHATSCFEFQKKLAHADLPRPGLRLRQLPRHHLPRTAPAGAGGAARGLPG